MRTNGIASTAARPRNDYRSRNDGMRILLPGGSGQVGTVVARAFHASGHEVVVLSRTPASAPWRVVAWDAEHLGSWASAVDGSDVVINLAGRSVNCRYTPRNRRDILESRVRSTRVVGAAIAEAAAPPAVWLQASTATIYAHRYDAPNDESGPLGGTEPDVPPSWHFSIEVAQAWERACLDAPAPRTRKVLMRSAMIMSPDPGGIFDTLLGLVRRGLGGTAASGRQFISWIHERDFVRAVEFLIATPSLSGPVNISAPHPLPNQQFMEVLRRTWGTRIGLPATRWMLHAGAILLGTETELILKSRRVVPGRLRKAEFGFDFPTWPEAAAELCERRRAGRVAGLSG